jgi:acyl-CoA thioester hydrolase
MNPLEKKYPVVLHQDVIWGDMDAFGHINNTVYFRYFEDARIAYFDRIGVHDQKERFDIGPILASTQCNFRLPLDYPDRIHIATRAAILSPKKLNMEYAVFSERHGAITAEGEGLIVYYDYASGKSCEIPDAIVAAIEALGA